MRLSLLCVMVLSGCMSAPVFERGDVAERQFNMDSADCEMRGEQSRNTGGMGGLAGMTQYSDSYNRVYGACMRAKGYARKGA